MLILPSGEEVNTYPRAVSASMTDRESVWQDTKRPTTFGLSVLRAIDLPRRHCGELIAAYQVTCGLLVGLAKAKRATLIFHHNNQPSPDRQHTTPSRTRAKP